MTAERPDLYIKTKPTENIEQAKERGVFWLQANDDTKNLKIATELNKSLGHDREWNLGYTDYHFDVDVAARALQLDQIIQQDQEYQNLINETGNPLHYLVQLRAREIIIENLLPLAKEFALVNYDEKKYAYVAAENTGESYGITGENIRNLIAFLILTTKGTGHKSFFLDKRDFESATEMVDKLSEIPYKDFGKMCDTLRGEDLAIVVHAAFTSAKEEARAHYQKQLTNK